MAKPICRICAGTGVAWYMRSWFRSDGFYRQKCWCCEGSGRSSFQPSRNDVVFQRAAREHQKSRPSRAEE